MKAAVVEKPGVLAVREVPMPEMGEYDVLCETLYGATCTGTDLHIIGGHKPHWGIKFPSILGHESVGRVAKLGPKVRNFKVGDLICSVWTYPAADGSVGTCFGGFAEFTLAADFRAMSKDGVAYARRVERQLPLPDGFDPRAATMIVTWRETLSYLTRMGEVKDRNILVIGSGGTGLSFGVHAKNLGAAKIAMVGSGSRGQIAMKIGFNMYFDYKEEALKDCGETFDFIIDSVGKIGEIDKALGLLRPGGIVGIYGLDDEGKVTVNPAKAKGTFSVYNGGYDDAEKHYELVDLMLRGKLDASMWMDLDHPYPLARIVDAFRAVESKKEIKALVKLRD